MRNGGNGSAYKAFTFVLIALILNVWAAPPVGGAALSRFQEKFRQSAQTQSRVEALFGRDDSKRAPADSRATKAQRTSNTSLPRPARFREVEGRGLLVRTWVNGAGPYSFAVDTGAGATILSRRVAAEARVPVDGTRTLEIGGLSGARAGAARRAFPQSISIGERDNLLPADGLAIVADGLPADVDGVLDPTEAFWPLGYVIDIPAETLSAFDPRIEPLRRAAGRADEAVVPWLTDGSSRRPFVTLSGARRALIDTGSGFGLALNESAARALGIQADMPRERAGVRDIAGGRVGARRVRGGASVSVGPLVLRGVPTDLLHCAEAGAPALLGRDALRPFRLAFDPLSRLIKLSAAPRPAR